MKIKILVILLLFSNYMISNANENSKKLNVCILIYNDVYLLDFAGPLELFYDTQLQDGNKAFDVFLVAPDNSKIKTHTGTIINPDFDITNCPVPDILVVPGGNLSLATDYPLVAEFIKNNSKNCKILMSVCTGSFILADLGLLDGKEVTTWYGAKDKLQKKYPKIKISNKRFTDCENIITTAGISAGIDGSFYVVKKIYGEEIMNNTAKYIEWDLKTLNESIQK